MNKSRKHAYPHFSMHSIVTGLLTTALTFSVGCGSEDQDGKDGKDGTHTTTTGNEGQSTSQGDKQTGDETNKEGAKTPTQKKVQVKLSEVPQDIQNLRVAVHPELGFSGDGSKLGEALADVEAKFDDASLLELTVEPVASGIDLGEAKTTILYVSLYEDKDDSKSFNPGEQIVGSVLATLAYSRADNAKKLAEWTQVDMSSGKLVEVNKPLELTRLDKLETVESLPFPAKTESIEKEATLLGLVSPNEAKDFSTNFNEAPRGDLFKIDRDKPTQAFTLSTAPDKARQGSKTASYLPRFKNMSINLLAGFKSADDKVTKDTEIVGYGCVALEFSGKRIYDSVIALWVEPGPGWVSDPASAYTVITDGYRPGWNPIAVQAEDDGSSYAYRMGNPEMEKLAFSVDCKARTK